MPNPFKCCPISLTMSLSQGVRSLTGIFGEDSSSEQAVVSPFVTLTLGAAAPLPLLANESPLCTAFADEEPVADCMVDRRCFFTGGGDNPPLSESEDDASIAAKIYCRGNHYIGGGKGPNLCPAITSFTMSSMQTSS